MCFWKTSKRGLGYFRFQKLNCNFSFSWRKDYNTKQNSYSLQLFFLNQLFEIGIPGNGLERDFLLLLTPASQPDQIEEVKEARLLAASTTPGIGQPL